MTMEQFKQAVKISIGMYGKEATIAALNKMYHAKVVTLDMCLAALSVINEESV